MTTLEEAWAWYQAAVQGAKQLIHLAPLWGELPWGQGDGWVSRIERDNVLGHIEADEMEKNARRAIGNLDDLAVLVLFSVFEANVRDLVTTQLRPEVDDLKHPVLRSAGEDVLQAVADGSFFRVLEPFKSQASPDLVEQVNQVRRYRNWVAHGRRADNRPNALVEPKEAYRRLQAFLAAISPQSPAPDPPPVGA